jgi:hypothetical protein
MTVIVKYRNQGKPEQAKYETPDQAKAGAEFLKAQGATHIKIEEGSEP